jgi:hypothetical protein
MKDYNKIRNKFFQNYPENNCLEYAYLVGLFEGNGYFTYRKKGKYLTYEMGIEFSKKDVQLIYKIKKLLGIGSVSFWKKDTTEMVSLKIRNKNHLKLFIIPIFDKYPMFSKKQNDYLKFKSILFSNIVCYNDIYKNSEAIKTIESLNTIESIIKALYFPSWLVGFIEAKGFFRLKNNYLGYFTAIFYITKINEYILIDSICKYLNLNKMVYKNKSFIKVTNVISISNIIKFLGKESVKLKGYRRLEYFIWIKKLRYMPGYCDKIKIPQIY